jgi:hypothetical protein
MGVPLAGDYDVLVNRPIDSRMVWTGTAGTLNQSAANGANRYPGMISYVTGDKNLYVYQDNNVWEKIVTNNVDSPAIITSNSFTISESFNGQVVGINNSSLVNATLIDPISQYPDGFNVTFIQLGDGIIKINPPSTFVNPPVLRNRLGLNTSAGKYAVISILRFQNSNEFFLYGDLI